jgi:hypothetical protein
MANEVVDTAGMNKARVECFSDGMFAFAITLPVRSIPIPDIKSADDQVLTPALLSAIPQPVVYVTSFATIGIIWLNHHTMFHEVNKVKHTTLTLNLLLLLVIAFIPYPTGVIGRYGALRSAVLSRGDRSESTPLARICGHQGYCFEKPLDKNCTVTLSPKGNDCASCVRSITASRTSRSILSDGSPV